MKINFHLFSVKRVDLAVVVFSIFLLVIFLDLLLKFLKDVFPPIFNEGFTTISDKILLITFFALVWYTLETSGLRKEAQKQTKFLLAPYLRLQWNNKDGVTDPKTKTSLQLVNVGQGVAQTIDFQKFTVNQSNVEIKSVTAMSSGMSGGSSATQLQYKNEVNPDSPPISDDRSGNIEIKISYEDIKKNKYIAKMVSNNNFNDGFQILEQKRIGE